jgi:hypothetical protein
MRSPSISLCLTATPVLFAATLFATSTRASAQQTILDNNAEVLR